MEYYYLDINNERQGPLSSEQFHALVEKGTVTPNTMVWKHGMSDWQPYGSLKKAHSRATIEKNRTGVRAPLLYAGFWIRVIPKIVDGVLLSIIILVPFLIFLPLGIEAIGTGNIDSLPQNASGIFFLIFFFLVLLGTLNAIIVPTFFLSIFAATPGKMLFGLKVYRKDGEKLSFPRALLRVLLDNFLSNPFWIIAYTIAAFHPEKAALHDLIAGTRVVHKQ